MITYQDLLKVSNDEEKKMQLVLTVINDHKQTDLYKNAILADEYDKRRNRTILLFEKLLYTVSGRSIPDDWSANYKLCSNFFDFFITQENQYLLGNGITWQNDDTEKKLGKGFTRQVQKAGKKALTGAVSFGFWNMDHLEVFGVDEFAPLYDEETDYLMSGVRFWQIDETKPLRGTLYEPDGYTEYIWRDGKGETLQKKRPYIIHKETTAMNGTIIAGGENYPTFPIVPLWGSDKKQSAIVGLQADIDAYDFIKSGFADDVTDAAQIYWILKNAGGMDDAELSQFVQRLHVTKAVNLEDGIEAEPHTTEVPYQARETLLKRLRDDLFEHAMAFDPSRLASGGSVVTAAIKAAYMPLDEKTDEYEYCMEDFLQHICALAGIEDENPTFSRSIIVNESDQIQTLTAASEYLPQEYLTEKILNILGDGDRAEEILAEMQSEDQERMAYPQTVNNPDEPPEDNNE